MKKIKILLAGIFMISLSGCASYYMKYDNSSVKTPNFYYSSNMAWQGRPVIPVERSRKGTICKNCYHKAVPNKIGECIRCGNRTASIINKICTECSKEIKACQRCLNPLYSIAYAY